MKKEITKHLQEIINGNWKYKFDDKNWTIIIKSKSFHIINNQYRFIINEDGIYKNGIWYKNGMMNYILPIDINGIIFYNMLVENKIMVER